jgi:hypothetical protein
VALFRATVFKIIRGEYQIWTGDDKWKPGRKMYRIFMANSLWGGGSVGLKWTGRKTSWKEQVKYQGG